MSFSNIIKTALKNKGMTQTALAVNLKTSPQNVKNKLDLDNFRESDMQAFAAALGGRLVLDINFQDQPTTPAPIPQADTPKTKPAPVPQTPPPYYVDYTKEQVQQWKRFIGTESAPMPPDSPDFELFKQFLDDFANKRTITFKEG